MDEKFRLIARPSRILEKTEAIFLCNIIVKLTPYFSYFFSKHTKIKPNTISITSIFFLSISFFFLITKNYGIAFLFIFLNIFLDHIDGELARINKQTSNFGSFLEKLNSDFFYLFFYNIFVYNFYIDGKINLTIFFILVSISLSFSLIRNRISQITLSENFSFNKINQILLGLFKYSNDIRNKNLTSKITYIFFWNIISSGGISETILCALLFLDLSNLALNYLFFYYLILIIYILSLSIIKIYYKKIND
tara:strand:- start:854 stop:1603 length:750 start_codon:yes stop_codon:yes gene_type:complete